MTKKQNVKIVKIPLPDNEKQVNMQPSFPRMPILYLELIENKEKIKQDLINKEHKSIYTIDETTVYVEPEHTTYGEQERKSSKTDNKEEIIVETLNDSTDKLSVEIIDKDKEEENKSPDSEDDNLSERLKDLLNDTDDEKTPEKKSYKHKHVEKSIDKYSRKRNKLGHSVEEKKLNIPPTLGELEANGGYIRKKELRDINRVSMTEYEEEDAKREMLFKFDLLKKSYPNSSIQEYSIHTDYETMKKSYDATVRRLSLDSSVESYKTYLIGGFMACEYVLGNFFNFDMQGFTQQQILSMNSYEKLLIELGEKSYVPTGSKWPVELRLLFMIIINAVFFIVSKMIMKKTGSNLMGMINNMNSARSNTTNTKKRKMRGPNIDLDNIPDLEEKVE